MKNHRRRAGRRRSVQMLLEWLFLFILPTGFGERSAKHCSDAANVAPHPLICSDLAKLALRQLTGAPGFALPLLNTFYGFFTSWTHEINLKALGNIPFNVPS